MDQFPLRRCLVLLCLLLYPEVLCANVIRDKVGHDLAARHLGPRDPAAHLFKRGRKVVEQASKQGKRKPGEGVSKKSVSSITLAATEKKKAASRKSSKTPLISVSSRGLQQELQSIRDQIEEIKNSSCHDAPPEGEQQSKDQRHEEEVKELRAKVAHLEKAATQNQADLEKEQKKNAEMNARLNSLDGMFGELTRATVHNTVDIRGQIVELKKQASQLNAQCNQLSKGINGLTGVVGKHSVDIYKQQQRQQQQQQSSRGGQSVLSPSLQYPQSLIESLAQQQHSPHRTPLGPQLQLNPGVVGRHRPQGHMGIFQDPNRQALVGGPQTGLFAGTPSFLNHDISPSILQSLFGEDTPKKQFQVLQAGGPVGPSTQQQELLQQQQRPPSNQPRQTGASGRGKRSRVPSKKKLDEIDD